jgi:hypothetical protein
LWVVLSEAQHFLEFEAREDGENTATAVVGTIILFIDGDLLS